MGSDWAQLHWIGKDCVGELPETKKAGVHVYLFAGSHMHVWEFEWSSLFETAQRHSRYESFFTPGSVWCMPKSFQECDTQEGRHRNSLLDTSDSNNRLTLDEDVSISVGTGWCHGLNTNHVRDYTLVSGSLIGLATSTVDDVTHLTWHWPNCAMGTACMNCELCS